MRDNLRPVADKAELLLHELRELMQVGPHLRIVHRFRRRGGGCQPGEEVLAVYLVYRGREIQILLPLALRLLLNYLAVNRHLPQGASQIAAGIRASAFYRRHAANSGAVSYRKISRSSIKEYVKRIRKAFALAFDKAALPLNPDRVLVSEITTGNEVQYCLRATIAWTHLDEDNDSTIPSMMPANSWASPRRS